MFLARGFRVQTAIHKLTERSNKRNIKGENLNLVATLQKISSLAEKRIRDVIFSYSLNILEAEKHGGV